MIGAMRGTALVVDGPQDRVLADLVGHMARRGFVVTNAGPASATFTRKKKPDVEMTLFLAGMTFLVLLYAILLVVLPLLVLVCYLLYFPVARPTATTGVTVLSGAEGSEIVLSGDDKRGKRDVRGWAASSRG